MKSKSVKFACVNIGLLALSYTLANIINILSAMTVQEVEIQEKEIKGFRG